jgi:hypothetical protein
MVAAMRGQADVVEVLLAAGASTSCVDGAGKNAHTYATDTSTEDALGEDVMKALSPA